MAPPVDSPFSAAVVSDLKITPAAAVAELLAGLERDELELHVGITKSTFRLLGEASDAAVRAVNAATGG